jgi:hypothetical protein
MIDDDFLDKLGGEGEDDSLSEKAEEHLRKSDTSAKKRHWAKVNKFRQFKDALEIDDNDV